MLKKIQISLKKIQKKVLIFFVNVLYFCYVVEDPRLFNLKALVSSEEKYHESLKTAVEVYGGSLRYTKNDCSCCCDNHLSAHVRLSQKHVSLNKPLFCS